MKLSLDKKGQNITPLVGHSHAASGLLHVATAVLACYYRAQPAGIGNKAIPWHSSQKRTAGVTINALGGESSRIIVEEDTDTSPGRLVMEPLPRIHILFRRKQY